MPRLRTDVPIAGSSGGSGAPSLEMMRLRGASMAQYLRKFHPRFRAEVMVVDRNPSSNADISCTLTTHKKDGSVHQNPF